ncbi:MAG TPA: glycogen debranching N-terminal domain-containing protein [Chloroflexia bacterium]|jgi:glycogen debranching enzyme
MSTETLLRVYPELLFAYHARSMLITDRRGAVGEGLEGLYERDMRLLCKYTLLVNGESPRLDAISAVDPYSTLAYYVAPPRREASDEVDALGLSVHEVDRQVVIRVARFVGRGLHEDVDVRNYGTTPARLELSWEAGADFADLMEARAGKRQQDAPVEMAWRDLPGGGGELRFDYKHPRLPRGVLLTFPGGPSSPRFEDERVIYTVELGPQESRRFCVKVSPIADGEASLPLFGCDAFGKVATPADKVRRAWLRQATRIETRNPTVQLAWDRAVRDVAALGLGEGDTPAEMSVPAAGVPLYNTLFGRDALTMTGQALFFSHLPAEGTLRLLAKYIGSKRDDFFDEEPGRVPQQVRDSPLALLGLTPWLHDYGDYAAPCAYLVLVGGHHIVAGNKELTREFLEPARRVLDWLDTRADLDGDGFLEYKTRSPKGQKHQGWKDSGDPVRYADGREVEPPIAPCEIQAYWYSAKLLMAEVFLSMGEPARAFQLFREAAALKKRFNDKFWMPDERFIAFGLDPDKKQIKSVASNAGHCLATGIIDDKYAPHVVRRLMSPDMFTGWGIRTLSSENPAYNPIKYHLGSVWPVENATIAFGMKRYGFGAECNALAKAMFDATTLFEHRRLPEAFGGFPRDARHPHPGLYPDACAPQGWSATAIAWFVQAMLGIFTYAPLNMLFLEPDLPPWLPDLTLRNLRVKDSFVTIRFRRQKDGTTDYKVLERRGPIHVLRQPPPGALNGGIAQRVRELVGSLLPGH